MKRFLKIVYYSFPTQLVIMHLQKNTMLLGVWVFVALLLSGGFGKRFGINYLFLDPEYLNVVSFWSFFFMGFAFGGFLMVWNITTYILNSFRFPFLASIKRPFYKYCINNFVLPLGFLLFYFYHFVQFQIQNEFTKGYSIFYYILGFTLGLIIILGLVMIYFISTNKSVFKFIKKQSAPAPNPPITSRNKLYKLSNVTTWKVYYYINDRLKIRRTRDVRHYSVEILLKVFRQHHYNAFVFQIASIISIYLFAMLMDVPPFRIPAGASILLLCTVLVSLIGAFKYWLRSWRVLAFIAFILFVNFASTFFDLHQNKAYGLDYKSTKAKYDYAAFDSIASIDNFKNDTAQTIQILNNWKKRVVTSIDEKPKMVILTVSGGGLRSAAWTTRVIQELDSVMNGEFLKHNVLMTGASGGMLGAAYMRDVFWKSQTNEAEIHDIQHFQNMSADLQNSVAFSIAVNDIFVPWIGFEAEGYRYIKDRGYAFERQLRENTNGLINKRLEEYREAERNAEIPLLFATPVIVNDARRLIISPQKVSYMMKPIRGFSTNRDLEVDGIDFGRLFEAQNAYNMRLTSALRMSATYPYILPNVTLPTEPSIEVMDAGWRDNYGFDSALRFINVFKTWINKNTSGVILVQIRAFEKQSELEPKEQGVISRMFNPLGAVGQMAEIQDYHQDNELSYLYDYLGKDQLNVVRFEYQPSLLSERASMSWHLTARERQDINFAIGLPHNQAACFEIHDLLED